jgi:hypothetical protein
LFVLLPNEQCVALVGGECRIMMGFAPGPPAAFNPFRTLSVLFELFIKTKDSTKKKRAVNYLIHGLEETKKWWTYLWKSLNG